MWVRVRVRVTLPGQRHYQVNIRQSTASSRVRVRLSVRVSGVGSLVSGCGWCLGVAGVWVCGCGSAAPKGKIVARIWRNCLNLT